MAITRGRSDRTQQRRGIQTRLFGKKQATNPKNASSMNAAPSNSSMFDAFFQVVRSRMPFQIPTTPKAIETAITRSAIGSLTRLPTENKPMVMGAARINICFPSSSSLSVSIIRWKGRFSLERFSCVGVCVEAEDDEESTSSMVMANSTDLSASTGEAGGPGEVLGIDVIEFCWI
ncbi:hypothetical protein OIU78_004993 [Salix suchowensis]|nr:hypothetical protein OIU78_004993 [Salix suchowensis]